MDQNISHDKTKQKQKNGNKNIHAPRLMVLQMYIYHKLALYLT